MSFTLCEKHDYLCLSKYLKFCFKDGGSVLPSGIQEFARVVVAREAGLLLTLHHTPHSKETFTDTSTHSHTRRTGAPSIQIEMGQWPPSYIHIPLYSN